MSINDLESKAAEPSLDELNIDALPPTDPTDDVPNPTSGTFIDYDDPFSFAEQSSGAPHVAGYSPYAWVGCGGNIYVLECLGKGYIRIEPVQDETSMPA